MKRKLNAFFRFFISPMFLINLALAIGAFFLTGWLLLNWLDGYSQHGEKVRVPNLIGIHVDEVEKVLSPLGLKYELDSVYVVGKTPGSIYSQDPLPTDCTSVHVKPERTIYVTMIRFTPPGKFLNPDKMIGHSQRIVEQRLEGLGFKVVKKFEAHPDTYVLDVRYKGKKISKDEQIPSGEKIEVVIGNGIKRQVAVPDLMGKTISEAKRSLGNTPLEIVFGDCYGCKTAEDSTKAVVIRQEPQGGAGAVTASGTEIILWFSTNPSINPFDDED